MGSWSRTYQDGWMTFTVPANVQLIHVSLDGAGSAPGAGGRVTGYRDVNPGDNYAVLLGEAGHGASGKSGGAFAQGGGGPGGTAVGSGQTGGASGGGASWIRRDNASGNVVAVAAGAGGKSGDNGSGGDGGAATGQSGAHGTDGSNATGNATGGTQSQGGNQGTSSSGGVFAGHPAADPVGSRGGTGGDPGSNYGHGGGGGGGGYHAGGGGQASSHTYAPGGGGGGGSNYTGGLRNITSVRAGGGSGSGGITITWDNPAPVKPFNNPPLTPNNLQIDSHGSFPVVTQSLGGGVSLAADTRDNDDDDVRVVFHISKDDFKTFDEFTTGWYNTPADNSKRVTCKVNISGGLDRGSNDPRAFSGLYKVRAWAQDKPGKFSTSYAPGSFFTNRPPLAPSLHLPANNGSLNDPATSLTFTWTFNDPDKTGVGATDGQSAFNLQYRVHQTGSHAGNWIDVNKNTSDQQWVANPNTFKQNTFYEWQVRCRDKQQIWGAWSVIRSFFVAGLSAPPILVYPTGGTTIDVTQSLLFDWKFKDPSPSAYQRKADLRWRVVDDDGVLPDDDVGTLWNTVFGNFDPNPPGLATLWRFPANYFPTKGGSSKGYRIEWEVRTYDTGPPSTAPASDWSTPAVFWTSGTPGDSGGGDGGGDGPPPIPDDTGLPQGVLGCGTYRVFLYEQGGQHRLGEITGLESVTFSRIRDDLSSCTISTIDFGSDCGALLQRVRSWMHELVVFRDKVRVWEGPITRLTYTRDSVQMEAKDVMGYVYRRIMRQGYNDAFYFDPNAQDSNAEQKFGLSVVTRAYRIIVDALSRYDPNVLPYLTTFEFDDDAHQTRIVPDYSQTAWQQVDDLAANAGLDYTTVGRRIILWDTHRPIGRLPMMTDGDFSDPPVVTEYGMQLCNYSAVTNNNGKWAAVRPAREEQYGANAFYGLVEMLASSYSETGDVDKLTEQARRNISDRWPTPLVVRVPDNSTLHPDTGVGFQQLIPGVWIPLVSKGTLREVSQWQKLDSITVTFANGLEQVQVTMSPAPNSGDVPDVGTEDEGS